MPILELDRVTFGYRNAAEPVLKDLSLSIAQGENLGIVGESGAGKSTVLSLLLGLTQPSSGHVRFAGAPLPGAKQLGTPSNTSRSQARAELRAFRRSVQMVFQDPYTSLDPRRTIGHSVAEPLRALSILPSIERADAVAAALESVALPADAARRYPHEFSGGQRQRIAIARAIISEPAVLLADEPVSALDVTTKASIVELLAELSASRGLTVVMVSHDLAAVAALCPHTAVLRHGELVEYGATQQILHAPTADYTAQLVGAIPRL